MVNAIMIIFIGVFFMFVFVFSIWITTLDDDEESKTTNKKISTQTLNTPPLQPSVENEVIDDIDEDDYIPEENNKLPVKDINNSHSLKQISIYEDAIVNFYSFDGRINRKQYFLIFILLVIGTGIISLILRTPSIGVIGLILKIPSDVRRLHDMNCSGWALIGINSLCLAMPILTPLIVLILWLILLFRSGDKDYNEYGELPDKKFKKI